MYFRPDLVFDNFHGMLKALVDPTNEDMQAQQIDQHLVVEVTGNDVNIDGVVSDVVSIGLVSEKISESIHRAGKQAKSISTKQPTNKQINKKAKQSKHKQSRN